MRFVNKAALGTCYNSANVEYLLQVVIRIHPKSTWGSGRLIRFGGTCSLGKSSLGIKTSFVSALKITD